MRTSMRWGLSALVIAGAAVLGVGAPVSAASSTSQLGLQAVSCTSATACTAVGAAAAGSKPASLLAERRSGATWALQTAVSPTSATTSSFAGVACVTSRWCVAVGVEQAKSGLDLPVAELWNGTAWKASTAPYPTGSPQNPLSAVSCVSTSSCMAVGTAETPRYVAFAYADLWNGTKWTLETVPQPALASLSGLAGVSCASATFCLAVGMYENVAAKKLPLVEQWNGAKWSLVTASQPAGASADSLGAVACSSPTACTAVGEYRPAKTSEELPTALRWNGKALALQTVPAPAGAAVSHLDGVACPSAATCVAVGDEAAAKGKVAAMAATWNGTAWSVAAAADPTGSLATSLAGVACTAVKSCVAVGVYAPTSTTDAALAEVWDGAKWVLEAAPN